MSARAAWIWGGALAFHLFLITAASLQDISASLGGGGSFLPDSCKGALAGLQSAAGAALGKGLAKTNPLRLTLAAYADATGIEAGYSYFAPSVSPSSKLEFELRLADGRIEHDLPPVGSAATGYRISTLLDHLQSIHYEGLRRAILQTLAKDLRREYPDAETIRATLLVAELPSLPEYRKGAKISYQPLYAYEFRFQPGRHHPAQAK